MTEEVCMEIKRKDALLRVHRQPHIGGRYYFKKNMAINVELGGGNALSAGKVGLSILLNKN